jgi:prevent-host-death family protein
MWTLRDADNRFSTVVEAAPSGTPPEVTRRGKPAVVVLWATDYRQSARRRRRRVARRGSLIPAETGPEIA